MILIKILIWADAGCTTGFGIVTHELASRMCAEGHEVHILAINYTGDPWQAPYHLYPASFGQGGHILGYHRLKEMMERIEPDVFFILNDMDVMYEAWQVFGKKWPVPTVLYFPIDADNWPKYLFQPLRQAKALLVQSHFGQRVIKEEANLDATVVWHGVDHKVFSPVSKDAQIEFNGKLYSSKQELKTIFGLEKNFVVLCVNRNTHRKNYYDTFRVFSEFHKRHSDAILLIHAFQQDDGGNLGHLVERYGLQKAVRFSSPKSFTYGVPKEILSIYYNMADVKVSMSLGEGFGMTDLEAIACGCPVIAQDWSATTEVVGPGGYLVKPLHPYTVPRMADYRWPDSEGFFLALEHAYIFDETRLDNGKDGAQHALQFNWDTEYEKVSGVLKSVKPFKKGGRHK